MSLVTWQEFDAGGRPQGGTIAELVLTEVTNLVSKKRPLMSSISSRGVSNTYVEILTDAYGSRKPNAWVEGVQATDMSMGQPTRHYVHVQSFANWGYVSDEQRLVRHYNEDPYTYQVKKRLNELLNDIEHAMHRGSAATGDTSANARQFNGLLNIFAGQSGTKTFTDTTGITFTEEVLVDLLQVFQDSSLDVTPTQAYVASYLKRTISEFSTRITRNVDAAARKQELIIERHASDFGDLDILYSEDQLKSASKTVVGNSISFVDPESFRAGWLKAPTVEGLARDGLRDRFQMNAQVTLVYDHEKGGGGGTGFIPYINQA